MALLPPLFTDVTVYDTQPLGADDPDNWISVGHVTDDNAGGLSFVPNPDGSSLDESGDVKLHMVASSGDEDMTLTRSKVMSMLASVQQMIAADMTLGGRLPYLTHLMVSAQVIAAEDEHGFASALIASVQYTTTSQ